MESLSQQRCFHHLGREAVARCLGCRRFFCRECVTEHDDRLICSACLKKIAAPARPGGRQLRLVVHIAQFVAGLFIAWLFFYILGQTLLLLPASFHEGTLWQSYGM